MYLSILIFPLLGSIVSGLLGRKIGVTGSHIITCTSLFISSILATIAFYEVGICGSPVSIQLINWIDSEVMSISWEFLFDQLTVTMFIPVLYISTLIHIYTTSYLSEDPAKSCGKRFMWGKLPNSGDILKLQVPSHNGNVMCGWTNQPCTVISLKIGENQMDNRGSKSVFVKDSVKEQRVDGSYCISHVKVAASSSIMQLRCTLMNCESFSRVKIPSNQINFRQFSTSNSSSIVNPWFWIGLIDAEGSFSIIVSKSHTHKLGWRVEAKFQMGLHKRDLTLLLLLQQNLGGVGTIYEHPTINKVNYSISSKKDLTILINHLKKYPLLTQKAADFIFVF